MNPIQVSQINYYIEEHLRTDPVLRKIRVIGEVANLKKTSQWAFFHLKDENALLACVSFSPLPEEIQEGNLVVATGAVRYYSKRGTLRLHVEELAVEMPIERAAKRRLEEERYRKMGWFDNRREFPAFPVRIGLITSKEGAAIDDVKRNIERRYPFATLVVIPVQVQGLKAPILIARAFQQAEKEMLDCIILTRGGGDTSDLEVFDDNRVVEAVYRSRAPVIAAIGHEKDWSFAELAADARASTPTGAAEFVVPTRFEIRSRLRESLWKANANIEKQLSQCSANLSQLERDSMQKNTASLENYGTFLTQIKSQAVRNVFHAIKNLDREMQAARDTEILIEKQWTPYQFYLQDQRGEFIKNDHKIPSGTYTIFGTSHAQPIYLEEEAEDGIL